MAKTKAERLRLGDFQTPPPLAQDVCRRLQALGVSPASIVEPTCGEGVFLRASLEFFPQCSGQAFGFDLNPDHVAVAADVSGAEVRCEDFFEKDWTRTLGELPEPVLVIGNPPWVTNARMGAIGGANLPPKSNSGAFRGIEAITGRSNFDVSEWMLSRLLEGLAGKAGAIAMICKTAVARKVLKDAWTRKLPIGLPVLYRLDADIHFGVAADICLLVCLLDQSNQQQECAVFPSLQAATQESVFALRDDRLIADLSAFEAYGYLAGRSELKWRSGVKHDCSKVMELTHAGGNEYDNGFGQRVSLENDFVYPMLKSSELNAAQPKPTRHMLVPQRTAAEAPERILRHSERTWSYLLQHADRLDGRRSRIYRGRPRFSVFGVGPYSFAPWKVAISGFYRSLSFRCVGPVDERPVVFDDTCYLLPCNKQEEAEAIASILNSETAQGFFRAFVFWDAKRPVTAQLLGSLDIGALAAEMGLSLPAWSDGSQGVLLLPR